MVACGILLWLTVKYVILWWPFILNCALWWLVLHIVAHADLR